MKMEWQKLFLLIAALVISLAGCGRSQVDVCHEIKKSIIDHDQVGKLLGFIDNESAYGQKRSRYPFGRGNYSLKDFNVPDNIGLADDAEAQIVTDKSGKIVALQILDSKGRSVIVLSESGRWYAWSEKNIVKVNDRVGVLCTKRD